MGFLRSGAARRRGSQQTDPSRSSHPHREAQEDRGVRRPRRERRLHVPRAPAARLRGPPFRALEHQSPPVGAVRHPLVHRRAHRARPAVAHDRDSRVGARESGFSGGTGQGVAVALALALADEDPSSRGGRMTRSSSPKDALARGHRIAQKLPRGYGATSDQLRRALGSRAPTLRSASGSVTGSGWAGLGLGLGLRSHDRLSPVVGSARPPTRCTDAERRITEGRRPSRPSVRPASSHRA